VSDPFDERYELGVPHEVVEEPRISRAGGRERSLPAEPFALHGCVLTPERQVEDGHVVIEQGLIAHVGEGVPEGVAVLSTEGVVLPGLVDLHGHPEYNVFAAWEPPRLYSNRGEWRRSEEYRRVVKEPWKELTGGPESLLHDLTRYAEARALVGGVTAIQGASARYPGTEEALVRNVDLRIFGEHRARSIIDIEGTSDEERRRLREQIDAGAVAALYVHLAEGVDDPSRAELDALADAGLLTPATVIIHGTALGREELERVEEAGAKLVWSPQSNLRLYGQTTAAADALELGIPLAVGADWLPSGSPSLLDELRVARHALLAQRPDRDETQLARTLVAAVTVAAAAIAGLADRLGRLEPGHVADVLVLERRHDDPWQNVLASDRSSVELVVVGGDLAYGRAEWLRKLAPPGELAGAEEVSAWGKAMLLDTSYTAAPGGAAPLRLADVRARLLARYPQSGPIFA
jgi:5-methylthioadenosine/S-adenosylhomocysteine deaminase